MYLFLKNISDSCEQMNCMHNSYCAKNENENLVCKCIDGFHGDYCREQQG